MFNLFKTKTPHPFVGKRVKCIEMRDEYNPVPPNTEGTIYNVGLDVMNVQWDNGRNIGLIVDFDRYEFINTENITND
jgi:hypothetical protein